MEFHLFSDLNLNFFDILITLLLVSFIYKRWKVGSDLQNSKLILDNFYDCTTVIMGVVEVVEDDLLQISGNAVAAKFSKFSLPPEQRLWASQMGVSQAVIQLWIGFYQESKRQGCPTYFEYNHSTETGTYSLAVTICAIQQTARGRSRFSYVIEDITNQRRTEKALRGYAAQLQQSLDFEAMLKRITDKVRDSLDEPQILDTLVNELGLGLGVKSCNAALYDLEARTSTIRHEYSTSIFPFKGQVFQLDDFPEIYNQLLQGQYFQFCFIQPHPIRGRVAILVCPLQGNEGVLGDLWLINDRDYGFRDLDLRLVQQAANQCAIAIRQSRLYQAVQTQVESLEQLNQLKDEFLSTISHELRTPISNIKLATKMLVMALNQLDSREPLFLKLNRYLQILEEESQREIDLINDLLDLSSLDVQTESGLLESINLQEWLPKIAEFFQNRAQSQQQQLWVEVAADLPPLTTNRLILEQILMELLNNACKYTPLGEQISVTARIKQENRPDSGQRPETPQEPATKQQWCMLIQVTNTGVEIPPKEHDRIFERFYRIPNNDPWKYGGTGLGLALARKRVLQLGGTIHVNNGSGQTTFTIELPLNHTFNDLNLDF